MNGHRVQPRRSIMERVWVGIAWLRIALSPTLVGAALGGVAFLGLRGSKGIVVGAAIAFVGLALGVLWAERARRSVGTVELLSAVTASSDLDRLK